MDAKGASQFDRRRFLWAAGGSIAISRLQQHGQAASETVEIEPISCSVYPAMPDRLSSLSDIGCMISQDDSVITLENGYLAVEISKGSGLLTAVVNKLLDCRYDVVGDEAGVEIRLPNGAPYRWIASAREGYEAAISLNEEPDSAELVWLKKNGDLEFELSYKIRCDQFWVERLLTVNGGSSSSYFEEVIYGRLEVPGGKCSTLELGKFDRPRLSLVDGKGGAFAGVGWWFYQVDDRGIYLNREMNYRSEGRFESEPWYVGVFAVEEGEPYPGWLWYKSFLQLRKGACDRQSSWSYWNAGWGQWGIDIDDPSIAPYLELIARLGVRAVAFGSGGSGKGIPVYADLAESDQTTIKNVRLLEQHQIKSGFLDNGGLGEDWAKGDVISAKLRLLDTYAGLGFKSLHFDFFETVDTYLAHRNIAEYFRAAREAMDYTECHLGMATYGPQFQKEVILNHPTDLHGFDISHFSSDWATFLGFRHSRREWQEKYDYLMPEYSLYYYVTHYSNWGHPRRYTDPEPQQFLYGPHAYCGIAYNFHDRIGFRTSLAAAAAFTPFYVFGHLELKMPKEDIEFTASYLKWVAENAHVLSRGRVCLENEEVCIVSKIVDRRGAIFLINYAPRQCTVRLRFRIGGRESGHIQPVYPQRGPSFSLIEGEELELSLPGEQVVILDVNTGLQGFPPENNQGGRVPLESWLPSMDDCTREFVLPAELVLDSDPHLPDFLVSLDQNGDISTGILTAEQLQDRDVIEWVGRGPLPESFLRVFGFRELRFVQTWKFVPWALPNRVWLVLVPNHPFPLRGLFPKLEINNRSVDLVPRVDYRPAEVADWRCPLFFADLTDVCRLGETNTIALSNVGPDALQGCYIVCAAFELPKNVAQIRLRGE